MIRGACLRHQPLWGGGFETQSCHFADILYKVLFPIFWKPAHSIFFHHPCNWTHNIQAGWPSDLRSWFKAQDTLVALVPVLLLSLCWHPYTKYFFLLSRTPSLGIFYHNPFYWPHNIQAGWPSGKRRWFMGTSNSGGVGSSPIPDILSTVLYKVIYALYWTPANDIFYNHQLYWPQNIQAVWPSGMWR